MPAAARRNFLTYLTYENGNITMLIKVQLDTPEVDTRLEPLGSKLHEAVYVWIEHTAVLSIQKVPGKDRFKVLMGGVTFPARGDADDFARQVNQYHRAYMRNPDALVAANDPASN